MAERDEEARVEHATMTTGVMRGVDQLNDINSYPPAPVQPAYVKEPLFSKKVLIGWGLATLIVWFSLTVIVPEIGRSIRDGLGGGFVTDASSTPDRKVFVSKNRKITIIKTDKGITVERNDIGSAAPDPVAPPAPKAPLPPIPIGKK